MKKTKYSSMLMLCVGGIAVYQCFACAALLGTLFTLDSPCAFPGYCGQSGALLVSSGNFGVSELTPSGLEWFTSIFDPDRGFAFRRTDRGLRMYVATEDGLRDYDGISSRLGNTVPVPDCADMFDVIVMNNGDVVTSCPDTDRLVRIDPASSTIVQTFSCCAVPSGPLRPSAITLAPDGAILAGRTEISIFDGDTGEFLDVAVEAGIMGAEVYDDFSFGPNGNLFVIANPGIGVLEFDGETFDFLRVFISADGQGFLFPATFAFSDEGNLFLGDGNSHFIVEFDGTTGQFLREVFGTRPEPGVTATNGIHYLVFRP